MPKKFKVLKVRDKTDNYSQKVERLWDVPFRALLVAKSGHGKSNLLTNMLLNEKLGYKRLFDGEDIHIFAPSIKNDEKMKLIIWCANVDFPMPLAPDKRILLGRFPSLYIFEISSNVSVNP